MSAEITSTKLDDTPAVGWTISESSTNHVPGDNIPGTGKVNYTVEETDDTYFAIGEEATLEAVTDNGIVFAQPVGLIESVGISGIQASIAQNTALSQFSKNCSIPATFTTHPKAALDLADQLAGNIRLNTSHFSYDEPTYYWSLEGHTAGFDGKGNLLVPSEDSTYGIGITGPPNVVENNYRIFNVKNLVTAELNSFADPYSRDHLYASDVTGPSLTVDADSGNTVTFKAIILAGATVTYSAVYGPDGLTSNGRNPIGSGKEISFTVNRNTNLFTYNINYRDSSGAPLNITNSVSIAAIDFSGEVQVSLSTSWYGGTNFLTKSLITDFTTYISNDSPIQSTGLDEYSEPFTIATTSGAGIRSLSIRTAPANANNPVNYTNYENAVDYVDDTTFSTTSADVHARTPLAPFTGTLWDYLNQVCSVSRSQIRHSGSTIILSDVGSDDIVLDNNTTPDLSISHNDIARYVSITNNRTSIVGSGVLFDAADSNTVITVSQLGESTTLVDFPNAPEIIFAPRARSSVAGFTSGSVNGDYLVSDANGTLIDGVEWVRNGGSVTAVRSGDSQVAVTVNPADLINPMPYTLSTVSSDIHTPTLKLRGAGTASNPVVKTLPTGASQVYSNTENVPNIRNAAVVDAQSMYTALAWASGRSAGPTMALQVELTVDQFEALGYVAGVVFTYKNSKWRIVDAQVGNLTASLTALPFSTVGDFESVWVGLYISDFETFWEELKNKDFNMQPLWNALSDGGNWLYPATDLYPSTTLYPGVQP